MRVKHVLDFKRIKVCIYGPLKQGVSDKFQ